MVGGVNCITSYYSFAGLSDEALRRLNAWVGRCCTMLTGGHQVADIALVYPIESVWPRFVPSHEWTREAHAAAKVESVYRAAMDSLYGARRDFTIADARALTEARVVTGTMVHGALQWRVVVLPGVDTLPLAAWENLARFVRARRRAGRAGRPAGQQRVGVPLLAESRHSAAEIFGPTGNQPTAIANASGRRGHLPAGRLGRLAADRHQGCARSRRRSRRCQRTPAHDPPEDRWPRGLLPDQRLTPTLAGPRSISPRPGRRAVGPGQREGEFP